MSTIGLHPRIRDNKLIIPLVDEIENENYTIGMLLGDFAYLLRRVGHDDATIREAMRRYLKDSDD